MTNASEHLKTDRLELVPSDAHIARAACEDRVALGEFLGCAISERWPPSFIAPTLERVADRVEQDPGASHWTIWYAIHRAEHMLVGNVAFQDGPEGGTVEIVYAMADAHEGKGFATEAVRGLTDWALEHEDVSRVLARVDPSAADEAGAMRVLEKAGFTFAAEEAGGVKVYERR